MFPIGNVDDFKIYRARDEDIESGTAMIARAEKANRSFLENKTDSGCDLKISGTFIYAHPPDYRGRPMLHASVAEWRSAFSRFKLMNIDTVIFQAALWKELEECYYNSKTFKSLKRWNVIEPMLEAAALEEMKVYLGGYGAITGWKPSLGIAEIESEIKVHLNCYQELLAFKDKFHGFYFPCETAFRGSRDAGHENCMNLLYRKICGELKKAAPEKMIITSPGTKYFPNMDKDFRESCLCMLDDVDLDVLVPQDSIGTCGNSLPCQSKTYILWKQVSDALDVKLWSNIEVFERISFTSDDNFRAAPPERIDAQLKNASAYVTKAVCWEALYFL